MSIHSLECLDWRICFVAPSAALEDYAASNPCLVIRKDHPGL